MTVPHLINFRLSAEDYADLVAECALRRVTISDAMRDAIGDWLDRYVDPPEPPAATGFDRTAYMREYMRRRREKR